MKRLMGGFRRMPFGHEPSAFLSRLFSWPVPTRADVDGSLGASTLVGRGRRVGSLTSADTLREIGLRRDELIGKRALEAASGPQRLDLGPHSGEHVA